MYDKIHYKLKKKKKKKFKLERNLLWGGIIIGEKQATQFSVCLLVALWFISFNDYKGMYEKQ